MAVAVQSLEDSKDSLVMLPVDSNALVENPQLRDLVTDLAFEADARRTARLRVF